MKASGKGYNDGFVVFELRYLTGAEVCNEKIYIQFGKYLGKIVEIPKSKLNKTHLTSFLEKKEDGFNSTLENDFDCRVVVRKINCLSKNY